MCRHFSRWRCSMAEYIEKQAALDVILRESPDAHYPSWYAERIKALPAADVVPVVRAEWVNPHWRNSDYCYDCSNCGGEAMHREYQWNKKGIYPICPNCGAKMDKEDKA